jgi:hypothetical protein
MVALASALFSVDCGGGDVQLAKNRQVTERSSYFIP